MRSFSFLPALLLSVLTLSAAPAGAAAPDAGSGKKTIERDTARIAVVVNDAAITTTDLLARYSMVLLSSGLTDTPENRSRIMPQAMRSLIDEQLQLQETRRQQIDVSDKEMDQALLRIAKDNNVPGGDMRAFFKANNVPVQTLENQIKANIAWGKLVQRQLRPRVEVSDDEVEEVLARMRANTGKNEYFVNEVFLPVDDPEQVAAVRGFAEKLLTQIKQTGAFGGIARQFSQGAGAVNGGEIGWVQQGTLAPELEAALQNAKTGDLIGPVKTAKGYHILAVRDRRTITLGGDAATTVKLAQIGHGATPQNIGAVVAEAKAAAQQVKSCAELDKHFPSTQGWQVQLMPEQPIAALPPSLAPVARSLPVGSVAAPEAVPERGVMMLAVCERTETTTLDRGAIMQSIGTERLENLARGLLRDLKRNAYIDMRL